MTDSGPSPDDISELWGEKPNLLAPAPLRHAEPAGGADALAVLQAEVQRLQALVAALDPAALRREAGTALETGLAALESRLGQRMDELSRRLDALTDTQAVPAREPAPLSSAAPSPAAQASPPAPGSAPGAGEPSGRHRTWRARRDVEGTGGPAAAPLPGTPQTAVDPAEANGTAGGVEARLGGRLDELADLVEGLVRRIPGRSAPSDPPTNGRRPVEETRSPIV